MIRKCPIDWSASASGDGARGDPALLRAVEGLLLPLYGRRVLLAATYLDDRISSGVLRIAEGDGPDAKVAVSSVVQLAEVVDGCEDGGRHEDCPRLNCTETAHMESEHRTGFHHLHAASALLVDNADAIRFAVPPRRVGQGWFLVSGEPTGQAGERCCQDVARTTRMSAPPF
ncbi:hypothetical protein ACIRVF_31770 [Kitasatospora sp. NPDC101157]|uniref:hypothetical protein n=1 Tax=Kitasatospora sp. NPDC101157 TaxID=3364098 RepID=UPI00381403E6